MLASAEQPEGESPSGNNWTSADSGTTWKPDLNFPSGVYWTGIASSRDGEKLAAPAASGDSPGDGKTSTLAPPQDLDRLSRLLVLVSLVFPRIVLSFPYCFLFLLGFS